MFPDDFKHTLLKNIHILILLNFVCIFVFDVETALKNTKLGILEGLELQSPCQPWWGKLGSFHQENVPVFYKVQMSSMMEPKPRKNGTLRKLS